jgi:outer membrane protein assembly factor BamD
MSIYNIFVLIAAAFYLSACASTPEKLQGADYYFSEGQKALEKNRCIEATEHFQRLVSNFPGSQRVTEAQYNLAEAFYCGHDYVNAAFEYQRLIDIYPASQGADQAQFKIGESYYHQARRAELDQKETFEALTAFRNFIEDNPSSPLVETARERIAECRDRLAQKLFNGADLYHRQGYPEAARISFQDVLRDYSDTIWYYHTLFQLGEIEQANGNTDKAVQLWKEVLEESGDEDLTKKVQKAIAKLSKSTG